MAVDPTPPFPRPSAAVAPPERFVVEGGGALAFALRTGDRARIVDPEGLQQALLHIEGDAGAQADTMALFEAEAPAGTTYDLLADRDTSYVLEAPGVTMLPDAQDAPTELHLLIDRTQPTIAAPPPPLAFPKLDLRVPAATARAFTVAAGDYIQIIDVEGQAMLRFSRFRCGGTGERNRARARCYGDTHIDGQQLCQPRPSFALF